MLLMFRWAALASLLILAPRQEVPATAEIALEYGAAPPATASLAELEGLLAADPAPLVVRFASAAALAEAALAGDRVEVELTGSERLVGGIGGGSGETLILELAGGTPLPLEIDALLALRFPERLPSDPGAGVEPAREGDRLYRKVGERLDRIDGLLEGFEPGGVRFESLVGSQLVPWEELAALFIEPLGGPGEEQAGADKMTLDLVDGTRLEARMLSSGPGALVFEVRGGARLELAPAAIARLSASADRLVYVSDLTPMEVLGGSAFGDEFGLVFRPNVDRAVHGAPLMVDGRRHPRGIGVQAPTTLRFELDQAAPWRALRGSVAIDASVLALGLEGSVRFSVLLDGVEAWQSERLTAGSGRVEMPELALEGARELLLEVSMEDGLNTGDRADWIDLRLVR